MIKCETQPNENNILINEDTPWRVDTPKDTPSEFEQRHQQEKKPLWTLSFWILSWFVSWFDFSLNLKIEREGRHLRQETSRRCRRCRRCRPPVNRTPPPPPQTKIRQVSFVSSQSKSIYVPPSFLEALADVAMSTIAVVWFDWIVRYLLVFFSTWCRPWDSTYFKKRDKPQKYDWLTADWQPDVERKKQKLT